MNSLPNTSISNSSSIMSDAYNRIRGASPRVEGKKVSIKGTEAFKMKSPYESMLAEEQAKRDVYEKMNPWAKARRELFERAAAGANEDIAKRGTAAAQFLKSQVGPGGKQEWTPELRGRYSAQQNTQMSSDAAREAAAYRNASRGY